jgi:hypothetical protein
MSHAPTPAPRPALRKAADGSVHPASAVLSSLAVSVPLDGGDPGSPGKKSKKAKKKAKQAANEPVEMVTLSVELPKSVRKALRRRASDYGWTAEEAAAHVLRVWADS